MKDKALAAERRSDRLDLRRVGAYRQKYIAGTELLVQVFSLSDLHIDARIHHATHQTGYDRTLAENVGVIVDIIPHDELIEREVTQDRLLDHVPVSLLHHLCSYCIEHQRSIYTITILRQRIEASDSDIEHLTKKLKHRDVQHRILIPASDHIAA